jgi:hypothetical protein
MDLAASGALGCAPGSGCFVFGTDFEKEQITVVTQGGGNGGSIVMRTCFEDCTRDTFPDSHVN